MPWGLWYRTVWLKNHKNQNEFDNININNNNNNVAVETSLPTSLSEPEPSPESYKENAHVASRDGEQMQMLDEASEEHNDDVHLMFSRLD